VFTGGIGAHDPVVREKICNRLEPLGSNLYTISAKSTKEALEKLEFFGVVDFFMSETAHVIPIRARKTNVAPELSDTDAIPSSEYYYAYSTIKPPDKGEVGGSSPPRPTIQITNIYAAILTFPLSGDLPRKIDLSTICQLVG
jgi:hypothetical protein